MPRKTRWGLGSRRCYLPTGAAARGEKNSAGQVQGIVTPLIQRFQQSKEHSPGGSIPSSQNQVGRVQALLQPRA